MGIFLSMGHEVGARDMSDLAAGRAMNAYIRNVVMPELAQEVGIDELPMRRPDFDFYRFALYQLRQMGFGGQNLYHLAFEVMQILVFNIGKAQQIPIHDYVNQYKGREEMGLDPLDFDQYYMRTFKRKALSELKKERKYKEKRGLSIDYRGRGGEDEGMAGLELVGDTGPRSREEAYVERKDLLRKIYEILAKDTSHRKIYTLVWKMMRKGFTLQEIANGMNARKIPTTGGKPTWGTSNAEKVVNTIKGVVGRFLGERGIDFESIVGSRKRGFRFGLSS